VTLVTPVRRRAVALVVVVAGLTAVVVAMASTNRAHTSGPPAPGLKLVFNDNFNGSRLNASHWSTCYWWATNGCTIATNHELEWYLPGQVQLRGGTAQLVVARRSVRGSDGRTYPFVSGMISSGPTPRSGAPKFAFRYGRVEARMRIPAGPGLWPAFWLLPADESDLPEIDVMEIDGSGPNVVMMHLHYRGPGAKEAVQGFTWTRPALTTGWHRFGIDWQPGRLDWLVDGVVRWHVSGGAVPSQPMYMIANLAVGGGETVSAPTASTPFPSVLQIDWVRVWQ
jgi:beta-glucanase (GH16 family)